MSKICKDVEAIYSIFLFRIEDSNFPKNLNFHFHLRYFLRKTKPKFKFKTASKLLCLIKLLNYTIQRMGTL